MYKRQALVGAEDPNGYADQPTVAQLLDQVRAEQGAVYTILLSHRNNHYAQYAEARADLTLSGHAHGGLIRLPGTDGLIGPKRELWPAYTAGLYDLDYGQMVVSRGLGNQFPCFRLFNRPDVPLSLIHILLPPGLGRPGPAHRAGSGGERPLNQRGAYVPFGWVAPKPPWGAAPRGPRRRPRGSPTFFEESRRKEHQGQAPGPHLV